MKVAKTFRWEGAHRLPWHQEGCQNLHGHSYRMTVELEGSVDPHGMVLEFKELKAVMKPLVDAWDHATLVAEYDESLQQALKVLGSKHYVLPYDTTSENLCAYAAEYLLEQGGEMLAAHQATRIRVRIEETETCFAELELPVHSAAASGDGAHAQLPATI